MEMTPSTIRPAGGSASFAPGRLHGSAEDAAACWATEGDPAAGVPVLAVHAATSTALASNDAERSQPGIAAETRIRIMPHDLAQSRTGAVGLRVHPQRAAPADRSYLS